MPLDKDGLYTDLLAAFLPPGADINPDSQGELENQVRKISEAIDTFVKSGDINGVTTVVTATIGTAPAVSGTGAQTVPVKIQ